MSKKSYLLIAAIIVLVVIFILVSGGGKKEATTTIKTTTANLATLNNSGLSGNAIISETEGKSKVVISIKDYPVDAIEPVRIHTGSCASLGGEKYSLTNVVSGASETVLDVSFDDLMKQLPLAINIQKSETEASNYVACGDITAPVAASDDTNTVTPSSTSEKNNTRTVPVQPE